MKGIFLAVTIFSLTISSSVFAQTAALPIKSGRFLIQRGIFDPANARIKTDNFEAISSMSYSNYAFDVCTLSSNPAFCRMGSSFNVPASPFVPLGDQGGPSPQFARGSFKLNDVDYGTVWFFGQFNFSAATFFVPHLLRRRGLLTFTRPFTMTGSLQACRAVSNPPFCRGDEVVYDGTVTGHGILTVTTSIVSNFDVIPSPFAYGQSIEYQFEP